MTERELTTEIINRIYQESNTSFAVKYHGNPTTKRGMPDLIGAWRGKSFAVEIKLPGKQDTVTLAQKAWLHVFRRGGYVVGIVTSFDEFKNLFDKQLLL